MLAVELVRYVHVARRRYFKAFSELSWDEVVKDRSASFSSLRDIFVHTINMEDRIINYIIPGRFPGNAEWDRITEQREFTNMNSIGGYMEEVESKVNKYLEKMANSELQRTFEFSRRIGPPDVSRVEDGLAHVAIENISHFGEMEAILYQLGKEAPYINWSNFLKEPQN